MTDHAVLEREEALAMVDASDAAVEHLLKQELVSLHAQSVAKAELVRLQEADIAALKLHCDELTQELRLCRGQLLLQEIATSAARVAGGEQNAVLVTTAEERNAAQSIAGGLRIAKDKAAEFAAKCTAKSASAIAEKEAVEKTVAQLTVELTKLSDKYEKVGNKIETLEKEAARVPLLQAKVAEQELEYVKLKQQCSDMESKNRAAGAEAEARHKELEEKCNAQKDANSAANDKYMKLQENYVEVCNAIMPEQC